MKKLAFLSLPLFLFIFTSAIAENTLGKSLYETRCAICHGKNGRGTGPLAQKSTPPALDLTSCAYQERLKHYPGAIVSSIVLRPNGSLIPNTLKKNGVLLPAKTWTDTELRAINRYILDLSHQHPCGK